MLKKLCEYNIGEELDLVVLIKDVRLIANPGKKPFLVIYFADSSGMVRGHFWDAHQSDLDRYRAGSLVELNGKKEDYKGQTQIKIYSIRLVGPNEGYQVGDFIKSAPIASKNMQEQIELYVRKIKIRNWQRIVAYLLDKWHERFYTFPGGKSNHHAVKGGLAFHTLTMLRLAQRICEVYPELNASLLYAGCILHDLGKVLELSSAANTSYTLEGNLIGHLVLGDEQIVLACQKLKIDVNNDGIVLLRHLVLSHNGKLEYGSPKLPALAEAEVLHRIDDMDAALNAIFTSLELTKSGDFTEPLRSRAGQRYYHWHN